MDVDITSKLGLSLPTEALALRHFPFPRSDSAQETRTNRHSMYPRKAGWVVGGEEEKQTEVGAGWVSQLLSCGGRGAEASRGSMAAAGAAQNTAVHSCPLTN